MPRELPDVGSDSNLGDRVRAAIKVRGFDNVKAFAAANSLAYESLISVLSGRRGLSDDRLKTYADMLDVPAKWLRDGPNGHARQPSGMEVEKIISWNWTPIVREGAVIGGNALRRLANPHYVGRIDPPFGVPAVKREALFAAYCDGTTDASLIEGTMLLCSRYFKGEVESGGMVLDTNVVVQQLRLPPIIGYLLREEKNENERYLPFLHQIADIYACPAVPTKGLRLPSEVPSHHEIIGVIHAFWRAVSPLGDPS